MKVTSRRMLILGLFLFVFGTLYSRIVERIVVKVNDEIITMYDIAQKRKSVVREHRMLRKRVPRNINKVAIDQLINEKLVFQMAKKEGIVVNRLEVEDRINKIMKSSGRGGKPLTSKQFRNRLRKEGLTYADFFQMQKRRMVMQKLFRKQSKGMSATDAEIDKVYKEMKPKKYRILHLYIPLSPGAGFLLRGKIEKKIKRVSAQLKANRWNFMGIAARNRVYRKDFGYIVPSAKMPKYLYPIFSGRRKVYRGKFKDFRVVNEIPGYAGYHALFVHSVKLMPLKEAYSRVRGIVLQRKMEKALKNWVKKLRKKAVIAFQK